jgi:DNA-binding transcriptional MerR regulator
MFTVGEFSRIAHVSKRLLRYYDEIGLLKPMQTDPATGYRYYSAEQLPLLNRILVLKDLGLSLEQVQRLLSDNISTEEIHGMLLLRKAETERRLKAELQRIRSIEARLQSIQNAESSRTPDVIIKQLPAQQALSVRMLVESFEAGLAIFSRIGAGLPEKSASGWYFTMCHDDEYVSRDMDLEMGYLADVQPHAPVPLGGGLRLQPRQLPEATMATMVVKGGIDTILAGYMALGTWIATNEYHLADTPREITLQVPQTRDGSDLITEIQFPIAENPFTASPHPQTPSPTGGEGA